MNSTLTPEDLADRDARIRELAYQLWEAEGCPHGQADRHWFMAIAMLDSGVADMLPGVPVDDPHWKESAEVPEVVIAKPVIQMSGRPAHETAIQPTVSKTEPRQKKAVDRMI